MQTHAHTHMHTQLRAHGRDADTQRLTSSPCLMLPIAPSQHMADTTGWQTY